MIEENLEYQLIEATQPIRSYALSTAIYHLFNQGIYDKLFKSSLSVEFLAEDLDLDNEKLLGFLKYLVNEGIVEFVHGEVRLTPGGLQLNKFRSWYTMFVGGYGSTFLQIGDKLKRNAGWASRDTAQVGIGSCGISHYDAIPLARSLMSVVSKKCKYLLDVGCGNALYLVEFCQAFPEIKAWGVEPDKELYQAAIDLVCSSGLEEQVFLTNATALEFVKSPFHYEPDLMIINFILHEILSQTGEKGVIKFLRGILNRFPDIYIIVIEVDEQISNKRIMSHGLSRTYYNPYYLLHYFTNQKLETQEFWEKIFKTCQLEIQAKESTDINVDSTGLEIGYLLKQSKN